jgi:hypothetical protein
MRLHSGATQQLGQRIAFRIPHLPHDTIPVGDVYGVKHLEAQEDIPNMDSVAVLEDCLLYFLSVDQRPICRTKILQDHGVGLAWSRINVDARVPSTHRGVIQDQVTGIISAHEKRTTRILNADESTTFGTRNLGERRRAAGTTTFTGYLNLRTKGPGNLVN